MAAVLLARSIHLLIVRISLTNALGARHMEARTGSERELMISVRLEEARTGSWMRVSEGEAPCGCAYEEQG